MSGRPRRILMLIVLLALILPAAAIPGATAPDGDGEDLDEIRWTPADSPVVLNASLEVNESTRLVIEAGVEVLFDEGIGLQVKGLLLVQGTEVEPVRFGPNTTGPLVPDHWADVRLLHGSAGRSHEVRWAVFEGADAGLLVSSTTALVEDCTFTKCRYGVLARGDAFVDMLRCDFVENKVLGLELESGAGGRVRGCTFEDNVVGIYCFEGVSPEVMDCTFTGNYHHLSFSNDSAGTIRGCRLENSTAEVIECYWNSSPRFQDVNIHGPGDLAVTLRGVSRPSFVGGTPVSDLTVYPNDNGSYAIALTSCTIRVVNDKGRSLEGANVTLAGTSGQVFTRGITDRDGKIPGALISMYTVGAGGSDRENPHEAVVEWKGHNQTYSVDPRDLSRDRVLELELVTSPPEPGGLGWLPNVLVLLAISGVILAFLAWKQR